MFSTDRPINVDGCPSTSISSPLGKQYRTGATRPPRGMVIRPGPHAIARRSPTRYRPPPLPRKKCDGIGADPGDAHVSFSALGSGDGRYFAASRPAQVAHSRVHSVLRPRSSGRKSPQSPDGVDTMALVRAGLPTVRTKFPRGFGVSLIDYYRSLVVLPVVISVQQGRAQPRSKSIHALAFYRPALTNPSVDPLSAAPVPQPWGS